MLARSARAVLLGRIYAIFGNSVNWPRNHVRQADGRADPGGTATPVQPGQGPCRADERGHLAGLRGADDLITASARGSLRLRIPGRYGWSMAPRPSSCRSPRPTGRAGSATARRGIVGKHDRRPGATPRTASTRTLGSACRFDIVGLRPVRGDQPEGVAARPFPTGVCRASPVRRPVVSRSANGARRQARAQGQAGEPLAAPLQRDHHPVLPRAHTSVVPYVPPAVNVGSATCSRAASMPGIGHRRPRSRPNPNPLRQESQRSAVRATPVLQLSAPRPNG